MRGHTYVEAKFDVNIERLPPSLLTIFSEADSLTGHRAQIWQANFCFVQMGSLV